MQEDDSENISWREKFGVYLEELTGRKCISKVMAEHLCDFAFLDEVTVHLTRFQNDTSPKIRFLFLVINRILLFDKYKSFP